MNARVAQVTACLSPQRLRFRRWAPTLRLVKPAPMPVMTDPKDLLAILRDINRSAAFNHWCGIEVISAGPGKAEIAMPWRDEVGQYAGFLHAGLIGALIDTACGYAAVTLVGRVLASHYSVNCLRPAVGERFVARARVIKPGRTQVFTACELYAQSGDDQKLVATGETLLTVTTGAE
jgi:uncharacterized protein (TIGR00369 family)